MNSTVPATGRSSETATAGLPDEALAPEGPQLPADDARDGQIVTAGGFDRLGLTDFSYLTITCRDVERVKGIEPSYEAWEAAVLPLNYTRDSAGF